MKEVSCTLSGEELKYLTRAVFDYACDHRLTHQERLKRQELANKIRAISDRPFGLPKGGILFALYSEEPLDDESAPESFPRPDLKDAPLDYLPGPTN